MGRMNCDHIKRLITLSGFLCTRIKDLTSLTMWRIEVHTEHCWKDKKKMSIKKLLCYIGILKHTLACLSIRRKLKLSAVVMKLVQYRSSFNLELQTTNIVFDLANFSFFLDFRHLSKDVWGRRHLAWLMKQRTNCFSFPFLRASQSYKINFNWRNDWDQFHCWNLYDNTIRLNLTSLNHLKEI